MVEKKVSEPSGNKPAVNEKIVEQFKYLQHTIGNQEVQNLINAGVLNSRRMMSPEDNLMKSESKKAQVEAAQIAEDRNALEEEIGRLVAARKQAAENLVSLNPGKMVYVNISTELIYAQIPGENALEFYHYTKLNDIGFSLQNINTEGRAYSLNRGKSVPVTYSIPYIPAGVSPVWQSEEKEAALPANNSEAEEPAELNSEKTVPETAKGAADADESK